MNRVHSVFNQFPPPNCGKLLFTSYAHRAGIGQLKATLYQKCLLETSVAGKLYIVYDFDIKYSFTAHPPALTFESHTQKYTYELQSEMDLHQWRLILRARLNQRGFHEQFKPKKKIGKGNFASVYLTEKLEDGNSYAVKAFSKQSAYSGDNGKECLMKQIEVMRALSHSNCMRLYQVFESDNSIYMVIELLEGGQLYDKIQAKYRFRPQQTRAIIYTVLGGLREMHTKGIMHRDLKPENLIFKMKNSMDCVIADFGLAEVSNAQEYLFVRCGTPGFVAPEVINIRDLKTKYEPICDMFSMGLVFHLLLLGVSAFPGKTYNQILIQNRASNFSFDAKQYATLQPEALDLLKRMLQKLPQNRITVHEALQHPYFGAMDVEIAEETNMAEEYIIKGSQSTSNSLLATQKQRQNLQKDSCIEFKFGKENPFTGKTDAITESGSTFNSVQKHFQTIPVPKISKFSTKKH